MGRVLSLFTGAGGLDLGLEQAGLVPVACLDTDPLAQRVLAFNRPDWPVYANGEVSAAASWLTPADLQLRRGELDLIVGGPPCQPFSKAAQWASGSRIGLGDPRAQCVHGMLDLVEIFLPRALLIENVAGFLRGPVSALDPLQDRLQEINRRHQTTYSLAWQVVDSADYGVPQNRHRAIAIAYRDGQTTALPLRTHVDFPVRAWDALWDLEEARKPSRSGYWADLLPSIPEGANYQYLTGPGQGEELFGWRTRYWSFLLKLAKGRPSWTLPASPGPSTGPFHWDNRPLSIREQMRLQSFPDYWSLVGAERDQRRLAGNATPPLLAEVLGRMIFDDLELGTNAARADLAATPPRLARSRCQDVPAAVLPEPVPLRFKVHIAERAAHPGVGLGPAPRARRGNLQHSD